jgi:hypothetical protein
MMDNTALCQVSVGKVFQLGGAPLQFSCYIHAFRDREFTGYWMLKIGDLTPLNFFLWGVY